MGKDLNGKELGRGITQRKDGRYMGRIHIKGSKKEITLYDRNLKMLKNKVSTYNPCEGMRAPTERTHQEIIEREENQNLEKDIQRFLDACRHTRYYELFYILSRTGLRIGEACALEWKDVDLERKCIYIDTSLQLYK